MENKIYSVRDVKTGYFAPVLDRDDASAIRGFALSLQDPHTIMGFTPQDFDLYCLGVFETETGRVTAYDSPAFVISGPDAYNMYKKG